MNHLCTESLGKILNSKKREGTRERDIQKSNVGRVDEGQSSE